MARIHLDGIAHTYTPKAKGQIDWALKHMDLTWRDGGAYALLGPSGCGKTTLLNVISGLVQPSEGRVTFDDVDVTDLSTERRNIAQVFQFPVIYDTMTVFENLAFPLRNRGVGAADARARVEEVAEMLGLTADLHHRARGLTADSKQKISLGRGLVRSDVAAILFDEPLTVIDPQLKFQLRRQIKQIHEDSQLTFIYVTHDQNEALTFADQVVLMSDGAVVQAGTPQELFESPKHTFVGYFIGSPGMNILPCALDGDAAVVEGRRFPLGDAVDRQDAKARRPSGVGHSPGIRGTVGPGRRGHGAGDHRRRGGPGQLQDHRRAARRQHRQGQVSGGPGCASRRSLPAVPARVGQALRRRRPGRVIEGVA